MKNLTKPDETFYVKMIAQIFTILLNSLYTNERVTIYDEGGTFRPNSRLLAFSRYNEWLDFYIDNSPEEHHRIIRLRIQKKDLEFAENRKVIDVTVTSYNEGFDHFSVEVIH